MRREEVIRKRWMNKRKEQRKKILLAAWPGMPERHRPDFYELSKSGARAASRNIEAFKYPYVNQEDALFRKSIVIIPELTRSKPTPCLCPRRSRRNAYWTD